MPSAVPIYYRPRMLAQIEVPLLGTREQRTQQEGSTSSQILQVHPKSVRLESNDHNHADSCELTVDWTEAGVDPRMLDNAVVAVWIANTTNGFLDRTRDVLRFVGLTKEIEATRSTSAAAEVRFSCIDYTTCFLEAKPFGSSGIPWYDQTLEDAWRTIVSQTPGAEQLADRLVLEGLDTFPVLGKAVASRFAKIGKVPVHPDTDAWAVWQQCVGMCGLISYIRLDECVITTATNYYSEIDSPLMIWGMNLEEWSELRHTSGVAKGIGCTAYNPLTQRTIEAFYPPVGDKRLKHKRANAKPVKAGPSKSGKPRKQKAAPTQADIRLNEERDYFPIQGITEEAALLDMAKRIYEERSRQECEGSFKTREMSVLTEHNDDFDMLALKAGDTVRVEMEPDQAQTLAALPSDDRRREFLTARGYTDDIANLIIKNMEEFTRLGAKFHVHSVTTELRVSEKGGSFSIQCHYINRINVLDGSATVEGAKPKGQGPNQQLKTGTTEPASTWGTG